MDWVEDLFVAKDQRLRFNFVSPSSSGLGHRPLTAATGIRIP